MRYTNAIEIRDLTKRYPDFTLNKVNITLPSGCIMGFIGENGAGKSTTIKLILNLIHRGSGQISVLGTDIDKMDASLKEHIGVVLDESYFPDNLSASNINTILKSVYKTWDEQRFAGYLQRFSLPEKKAVKDYSRGMKMKLAIAVALSHDSKLLILDEATSGLDPIVRDEILDVFLDFIQDETHSIFISSHIVSDLEKICDYITFIHRGSIQFSEPKDELLAKYGILKCRQEDFDKLNKQAVIGYRQNHFGVEALVYKQKIGSQLLVEPASIENIMLYHSSARSRNN